MTKKRTGQRKELEMDMLERAARTLRVMAHPMRLKMAELLLDESFAVGELAEAVGLPPAAVSQHLNIMRAHGVVQSERSGRSVFYEVINPQAKYMIDCLRTHSKEI